MPRCKTRRSSVLSRANRSIGWVAAALCTHAAHADLEAVTFVDVTKLVDGPPGTATYRLVAHFDDPTDAVIGVGALQEQSPLSITTTCPGGFLNDLDSIFAGTELGDLAPDPAETALWDSYLTIGATTNAANDTAFSPGFAGGLPPIVAGTSIEGTNGGWYDGDPTTPADGGVVVLGQFTVGDPSCSVTFSGCVKWVRDGEETGFEIFETTATAPPPFQSLFIVAGPDDPTYRGAVAALTFGNVFYFDGRIATPTIETLCGYDALHIWAIDLFEDRVAMGDVLADYADKDGCVVLGTGCAAGARAGLAGRIMSPAYCPVWSRSGGMQHTVEGTLEIGGDEPCIYQSLDGDVVCQRADQLEIQPLATFAREAGFYSFEDDPTEIATAYWDRNKPDRKRVIYANGSGGAPITIDPNDVPCWIESIMIQCHQASGEIGCPADLDGSGVTGFEDLLIVLANWGPCPPPPGPGPCPGDADGSGEVDFDDVLILLANWGPCSL